MRTILLTLYTTCTLFILSFAGESLRDYYNSSSGLKYQTKNYTTGATKYESFVPQNADNWANEEWNEWMYELEEDWKKFYSSFQNEKNKWFSKKEKKFKEWITSNEDKWMNFNENISKEHNCDIFKISYLWNDDNWKEWIKKEGRVFMKEDWDKWTTLNKTLFYKFIVKEWLKWTNIKIKQWLKRHWLHYENALLENWEHMSYTKILSMAEKKSWFNSSEQIIEEKEQMMQSLEKKEHEFLNNERGNWEIWEYKKNIFVNKWITSFINELVNMKQWNAWMDQRTNMN
ncbi:tryptophan-rich antigen [Plasmodium ovale wallikeri]|uniref:Tryptophan-rich antigen n=2 Tax=Plasmodium ovale TaxID=36330 RepID=A0A1A8YQ23_PLAOA|nr:tryptophan-rich antigen [Plasmodium ovale wallikeri]SBT33578.1 tryptophan-rich antigen [Plasmodium ovale wallikeri]SBT74067.1 tryptophan-rich protein [Plasmodium ovale]